MAAGLVALACIAGPIDRQDKTQDTKLVTLVKQETLKGANNQASKSLDFATMGFSEVRFSIFVKSAKPVGKNAHMEIYAQSGMTADSAVVDSLHQAGIVSTMADKFWTVAIPAKVYGGSMSVKIFFAAVESDAVTLSVEAYFVR
jgi:hypothetical protein